jgi:competence protein ComEC
MAEGSHKTGARPKALSSIALERLVAVGGVGRSRPIGVVEDNLDGETSWVFRTFLALASAVDASLSMGHGPAWLVVAFGAGLISYFALPHEPALWALYPAALMLGILSWRNRNQASIHGVLLAFSLVLGVLLGAQTARIADAPQILRETTGLVTGRIVRLEQRTPTRARLTLDQLAIEDVAPDATPDRIRITVIAEPATLAPGDHIEVLARLGPPPEPVMPGARNMRRELYFDGIGATGFSYGRPTRIDASHATGQGLAAIHQSIERTRLALAQRITVALPGDTGAIAAALLVGMRDGLSEESAEALRRAGLAHLLAISGMHMAMMTLSAIALINVLLALHPSASAASATLRWAAIGGLVIASGYLALSGASTATQRAFVMIVIVLVAMMASRRALTIRGVAFAAIVVLVIHPESLLGPSFQMSFAATLALIAFYGAWTTSRRTWQWRMALENSRAGAIYRPLSIVGGIALTSLVAGLATAPFAAYHFSFGAPLGLIGNVLALPLVSLIIMPAGLLALFLTPFALEAAPLAVMGYGIDAVMAVARWVASLDGSRIGVPAITPQALLIMTFAGCLAALFVGRARLLGCVPLALIPVIGLFQPVPLLIVERQAQTVALVNQSDEGAANLDRSIRRGSRFSVDMWHQRLALDPEPSAGPSLWTCDPLGCVATFNTNVVVAHVLDPAALDEDCRLASVVITALDAPSACDAAIIIDASTLRDHGAVALVADDGEPSGLRLWPTFERRTRPWEVVAD